MKKATKKQKFARASQLRLRTTKANFETNYTRVFGEDNSDTDTAFRDKGYVILPFIPDFLQELRSMVETDSAEASDFVENKVWEEDLYLLCAVTEPITPNTNFKKFIIPDISDYFYAVATKEKSIRDVTFVAIINPDVLAVTSADEDEDEA